MPEKDTDFGGTGFKGIVHVLAKRRGGVVVSDVAEGLDKSLSKEKWHGSVFFDHAVHHGSSTARRIVAPFVGNLIEGWGGGLRGGHVYFIWHFGSPCLLRHLLAWIAAAALNH